MQYSYWSAVNVAALVSCLMGTSNQSRAEEVALKVDKIVLLEQGRADADDGGSYFDGGFEIAAHAHR